jgi:hypothetical protein
MSIGLPEPFDGPAPTAAPDPSDPIAVLAADEAQLAELAHGIAAFAVTHGLDDHGVFRVAVEAVDDLPIVAGDGLRTVAGALSAGAWSPVSRLLAVAALLRALGYRAVPFLTAEGVLHVGLQYEDPPEQLNANVLRYKIRARRGGRAPEEIPFQWIFWDGQERLGASVVQANPMLPLTTLLQPPDRLFRLATRRVPAFALAAAAPAVLPVHGHDCELAFYERPDAASFVRYAPALRFVDHLTHAISELGAADMAPSLHALRDRLGDDEALVTALLRTLQSGFRYEHGALRSVHQILGDRTGDCDQLSSVMLSMLAHAGWETADFLQLQWAGQKGQLPGHVALAVRARSGQAPAGAFTLPVPGRGPFVGLDVTYYMLDDQNRPISKWGDMNPRYRGLRPQMIALG